MNTFSASLPDVAQHIRRLSIAAIYLARSGHPGGALSCADILAYLYQQELNISAERITDPNRDRFIMSKGHAAPALYAAAACSGFVDEKNVLSLRKLGSPMQGHPHVLATPWAETSTGSLGQGFSVALGIALGLRHQNQSARSYVLLGDGEMQEGEVWEAAMSASHFKLSNLCAVIDYNKMQSDDLNENIMGLEPLTDKWCAFGWNVVEIDGHDFGAIKDAFEQARSKTDRPTVIIAHTLKGKGVSYMEGNPAWHGSATMREDETLDALQELGMTLAQAGTLIAITKGTDHG
jgi:transketolase